MTYAEKLKDPRWQRKRLEILQRDNFTCNHCNNSENTLHVHHIKYTSGNPWETPNEYLVTLCEGCHEDETVNKKWAMEFLYQELSAKGYSWSLVEDLAGRIKDADYHKEIPHISFLLRYALQNVGILEEMYNDRVIDNSDWSFE